MERKLGENYALGEQTVEMVSEEGCSSVWEPC